MHDLDLLQRLAVALAIGLLIGIERGWMARDEAEGERTAGLRTLALSGLLGGGAGALALRLPDGGVILGIAFLAYALVIGFFRYREIAHDQTFGGRCRGTEILLFWMPQNCQSSPAASCPGRPVAKSGHSTFAVSGRRARAR